MSWSESAGMWDPAESLGSGVTRSRGGTWDFQNKALCFTDNSPKGILFLVFVLLTEAQFGNHAAGWKTLFLALWNSLFPPWEAVVHTQLQMHNSVRPRARLAKVI